MLNKCCFCFFLKVYFLILWFHIYEKSRIGKSTEAKWISGCQGLEDWCKNGKYRGVVCLLWLKAIWFFLNVCTFTLFNSESWTIKKAERRRIDAFEVWCWRRLLRVPWTTRRSNQSILKEISPEYSLEALMLKLKLQYFDYQMWRTDSLEKTLMLVSYSPWGRKESDTTEQLNWIELNF